ncbi:hypothetical protein [Clostridioides difficile]|nr:hypothetical protein [Clostridioides difficile]
MIKRNDKRPIYDQLVEILRTKIENEMEPNDSNRVEGLQIV